MWIVSRLHYVQGCSIINLHSTKCYLDTPKATFTYARRSCAAETGRFWHSHSATAGMFTYTRSRRRWICHFLRTKMIWSTRLRNGCGKLGVGPICCGAGFADAPHSLRDRVCVNACNDLCWSQFSAPLRSAHVWTYLNSPSIRASYGCLCWVQRLFYFNFFYPCRCFAVCKCISKLSAKWQPFYSGLNV